MQKYKKHKKEGSFKIKFTLLIILGKMWISCMEVKAAHLIHQLEKKNRNSKNQKKSPNGHPHTHTVLTRVNRHASKERILIARESVEPKKMQVIIF